MIRSAACVRTLSSSAAAAAATTSRPRRALLYMPGSNFKFLEKAQSIDADCICMDLEDAVAHDKKQTARENIVRALETLSFGRSEVLVRVNPRDTGRMVADDIDAVLASKQLPDALVLPKVQTADDVKWLDHIVTHIAGRREEANQRRLELVAMIESPTAVVNAAEIMRASSRLTAVIFGADDYAHEAGAERSVSNEEVAHARNETLLQARVAGLQAIDLVWINFRDMDGLRREAANGAQIGYSGKQIIHPTQVEPVQKAFSPSPERLEWARRIVEANKVHQEGGKGAFSLDGIMIDAPTVKLAEQVLARA